MRHYIKIGLILLALTGLWWAFGDDAVEEIRERYRGETPRETYTLGLEYAGLAETALGSDWLRVGAEALANPLPIQSPYQETGYLEPGVPTALGFQVDLKEGQQINVVLESVGRLEGQWFMDCFRVRSPTRAPRLMMHADSAATTWHFEAEREGTYLVRVQPELLRGGRYTLTLTKSAVMHFPVAGKDSGAIRSFFGDPRDGGRRDHHGVDIFAARGTPVVAAAEGVVSSVREGGLGGKVVWLRDRERGHSIYYAHLDSQLVRRGQRVQRGDTLGLVGNTGNARTTPPHLHFGIYQRNVGPRDPFPYVDPLPQTPSTLVVNQEQIGTWGRTVVNDVRVRKTASSRADVVMTLVRHNPVKILAGSGRWYRIALPDGQIGYVAGRQVEAADAPIRTVALRQGTAVRDQPTTAAVPLTDLAADVSVAILGQFGDFWYIQPPNGPTGWIRAE